MCHSLERLHAHDMTTLKAIQNRLRADVTAMLRDAKDSIEIGKPEFAAAFIQQALERLNP